ncbi:hypothetical protein JG688_00014951, partial [Phytophthora aleatoria]
MVFYCFILLLALALQEHIDANSAVITASSVNVTKSGASNRLTDARGHRHLGVRARSVVDDDEDISEENTIGIKLPGTAKLQSLVSSQAFKKFATNVKLRLTSGTQKTTDDLFKSLNIGEVKTEPFQFKIWAESVTTTYKKNPEAGQAAMVSTLRDHYGDEPLASFLAEALRSMHTVIVAKQFENILLDSWLAEKKTADEIFSLLKLMVDEDAFLKNPLLRTWMSYEKKLGTESPNHALLLKLRERYDDAELANMLIVAKDGRSTRTIAREVERAQLKDWLDNQKTTEDVFKLLRLNTD